MNAWADDNLMHYPLPPKLATHLRVMDSVAQKMAREGNQVSSSIALAWEDYRTVDHIVRAVSKHRYTGATVQWNGRPLYPHAYAVAA